MSVNKVMLIGRVGKDPEVRQLSEDTSVAKFSLATSETYKNKDGEKVETTEWHNIVIWRSLAGVVERYVKKGQLLYLEGKIQNRSYEDKEGNKRYVTEIVCDKMQMLGKNETKEEPTNDGQTTSAPYTATYDDLPF